MMIGKQGMEPSMENGQGKAGSREIEREREKKRLNFPAPPPIMGSNKVGISMQATLGGNKENICAGNKLRV